MHALHETIAQAIQLTHAATSTAVTEGSGVSSLLVLAAGGVAAFLAAGIVRAVLRTLESLLNAAVRVGMIVIAAGFGTLVLGVLYVANMVLDFVPS